MELTEEQKRQYLKKICAQVDNENPESAHFEADAILISILKDIGGFDKIIKEYNKVPKWYA